MSTIALAAGILTSYAMNAVTTYDVIQFPRQSDMAVAQVWLAAQRGRMDQRSVVGLDGTAGWRGKVNAVIELLLLTPEMRAYLYTNIFNSAPRASVTMRLYHPVTGWTVYNGVLTWPYADGSTDYNQVSNSTDSNVLFPFTRGVEAVYGRGFDAGFDAGFG